MLTTRKSYSKARQRKRKEKRKQLLNLKRRNYSSFLYFFVSPCACISFAQSSLLNQKVFSVFFLELDICMGFLLVYLILNEKGDLHISNKPDRTPCFTAFSMYSGCLNNI